MNKKEKELVENWFEKKYPSTNASLIAWCGFFMLLVGYTIFCLGMYSTILSTRSIEINTRLLLGLYPVLVLMFLLIVTLRVTVKNMLYEIILWKIRNKKGES